MDYRYLNKIESPADLKKVPRSELPVVAEELRDYMVSVISKIGGHLASSLGAVELTIALHYLYDTPKDNPTQHVCELANTPSSSRVSLRRASRSAPPSGT